MNVLITGGAGFIGIHLARRLVCENVDVTILDSFTAQVHEGHQALPPDIAGQVRLIAGDIRDNAVFVQALDKQDVIVHLAAETGTGQSMYEIMQYESTNVQGTAALVDYLVNCRTARIRKVVLASSRAVYGEGRYHCSEHGDVFPKGRKMESMQAGQFEPVCPVCAKPCLSVPTTEESPLHPVSYYGLTKQAQEQTLFLFAETLDIQYFALRFQNVYGPGQSLKNPYTGILAVFSSQSQAGGPIEIFEDGLESRDFVYVDDAVEALWECVRAEIGAVEAINIGSGKRVTVHQVATEVRRFHESQSCISVTGAFRRGDIRHNCADLTKAQRLINFQPRWEFADGLRQFLLWASKEDTLGTKYDLSLAEMRERGLLHG